MPRPKRGTSGGSGNAVSLRSAGTSQPNYPVIYLSGGSTEPGEMNVSMLYVVSMRPRPKASTKIKSTDKMESRTPPDRQAVITRLVRCHRIDQCRFRFISHEINTFKIANRNSAQQKRLGNAAHGLHHKAESLSTGIRYSDSY